MKHFIFLILLLGASLAINSCNEQSEYEQVIERELSSSVRIDSLFMGYHFGMSKDKFYDHSWKLNRKKLITNGSGASILKEIDYLNHPAKMYFYPDFNENKIHQMRAVYNYDGWAPWNKDLSAENLKEDIINYYEKNWDANFMKLHDAAGKSHTVSIKGNREIEITTLENGAVEVLIRDLRVEKNLERSYELSIS